MTQEELNYIKDSFSQILDDIGGNQDWYDAAKAVASGLGTIEKQLEERVTKLPSNIDGAANNYSVDIRLGYPRVMDETDRYIYNAFKAGAEWMAGQGFPRWRNIDEDKPKQGEDCACITVTVNGRIKYSNFEEGPWSWSEKIDDELLGETEAFIGHNFYGDKEYHTCSHWMPWDEFMGALERMLKK